MATQATLSRIAFSRIMLATNLSPESQNVLEYAISFAKRYESKLFIAHALRTDVCVRGVEPQWQVHDLMQSNADRELAILEQRKDLKSLRHEIIVRSGEPSQVLSALASDENVDLIVMGTHGRGCISQLFLGSTAETMIRKATCPVLTMGPHVKPRCLDRFGNILYTTDFSECSMRALTYALALAEKDGGELTMLHVIESVAISQSELVEWKFDDEEKLSQMVPIDAVRRPEIAVEVGSPAEEILRLASTKNTELIVMGSGHGGAVSVHLPGKTLHHVLQRASCPVLTVCAH